MQESELTISVIIPTLNEEANLKRCVDSLRDQATRRGAEEANQQANQIVVADGGSYDKTVPLARSLGCEVVAADRGRGTQLRAGVAVATGRLLVFLHADNWLAASALPELRKCWASRSAEADLFGCFRQHIDDDRLRFRWLEFGNALRATWLKMPYGDQAHFIARQTYDAIGGMPAQPLMEDVTFSKRAARRCRPVLLDGPVCVDARRWEANGVIRQTLRNWTLLAAYGCGVSPAKLRGWYR